MKNEEDFFLGTFAAAGERDADVAGVSEAPSRLSGLRGVSGVRGPSAERKDQGDPLNEDVGGEVAQVEVLAADDLVPTLTIERSSIDSFHGLLRYGSLAICGWMPSRRLVMDGNPATAAMATNNPRRLHSQSDPGWCTCVFATDRSKCVTCSLNSTDDPAVEEAGYPLSGWNKVVMLLIEYNA